MWTTPLNAAKFHFVWSTVPISENQTLQDTSVIMNWWAANAVGSIIPATPGQQQTVSFSVNGTGNYYAAMFTWDNIGNMSPMSNVASSSNDPFPTGVTTTSTTTGSGTTDNGSSTTEGQVSEANYTKCYEWMLCVFVALLLIN